MKQLIAAILTTWTANAAAAVVSPPTAAGPLFGIGGPFWDTAPVGSPWPYCIIRQMPSTKPVYGFGGGLYLEMVGVQFAVFAKDAPTGGLALAAGYADAIAGVFDANRLMLSSEVCKMARRTQTPMMKKELNYSMDGIAVYSGTLTYEYAVQRGSG